MGPCRNYDRLVERYEPVLSFDEEVAESYDNHPRGDEAEAVAFLEELARGGPALELAIGTRSHRVATRCLRHPRRRH